MKILHIASGDFFSTYGGGQVYVKNLVDSMRLMDCKISVISTVTDVTDIIQDSYENITIYKICPKISDTKLQYLISEIAPDIIHAHSLKTKICSIGNQLSIPTVVTSHHGGILCPAGTLLNHKDCICQTTISHKSCLPCVLRNTRTGLEFWYPFMRYLSQDSYLKLGTRLRKTRFIPFITPIGIAAQQIKEKKQEWDTIASLATAVVAPSNAIAEAMIRNGLDSSKVHVIPHGIPLPDPTIFQKYHSEADIIKFYYVGRICYVKGIHVLLRAFSLVKNPNIELHLIGGRGNKHEQQYMSRLQRMYRKDKRIVWHGKLPPGEVFNESAQMDVSISPAIYQEIFGLNIAESLALGKPVIATRSGGAEMQVIEGVNGWLIEPNNVQQLAERINFVAKNPQIIEEMSPNCHAKSIEEHATELIELYKTLLLLQN